MNSNTLIILLLAAFWGGTIIFVSWDTQRRRLTEPYRSLWLLLALIPLLGFTAYLVARSFLPVSGEIAAGTSQPRQRVTFLKREAGLKRLTTIPAAEYLRAAQPKPVPRNSQAVYTLAVTEGPHSGEKFSLDHWPICIGRGLGCDIRLDHDLGISRQHVELYQQAGKVRLRDLASTHGTSVNGYTVKDKSLTPGDQIHLGHSVLIFKRAR